MTCSFAKNIGKNLSGKYSQKCLDHVEQSAEDAPKTTSNILSMIKKYVKKIIYFQKKDSNVII